MSILRVAVLWLELERDIQTRLTWNGSDVHSRIMETAIRIIKT